MKSAVLFISGAVLILVAIVMSVKTSAYEENEREFRDKLSDFGAKFGNYQPPAEVKKSDGMPSIVVGGLGGICIIAGIVVLGTDKKGEVQPK